MSASQNPGAVPFGKTAWNKGKLVGPKPPLQPKHVWAIRTRLQFDGQLRDLKERGFRRTVNRRV